MAKSKSSTGAVAAESREAVAGAKAKRRAAKAAKRADRKKAKPAPKPERAAPTNTVEEGYTAKAKGVPVAVEPVQGRGGNRVTVFGHNVSAVLRWFGANGHGAKAATACLKALGLEGVVSPVTVGCQVYGHATRGEPADLTREEGATLLRLAAGKGGK